MQRCFGPHGAPPGPPYLAALPTSPRGAWGHVHSQQAQWHICTRRTVPGEGQWLYYDKSEHRYPPGGPQPTGTPGRGACTPHPGGGRRLLALHAQMGPSKAKASRLCREKAALINAYANNSTRQAGLEYTCTCRTLNVISLSATCHPT